MTLIEAVKKSLVERPDEWDFVSEETVGEGPAAKQMLIVLHRRTGLKVRAPVSRWDTRFEFWSPSAKQWWGEYDVNEYSAGVIEVVHRLRQHKLNEDMNGTRLIPRLEGGQAKFTADAEALARAILAGHVDAAFGAADEVHATMNRPQEVPGNG